MNLIHPETPVGHPYLRFINQPEIQKFLNHGGRVFAATEGRTPEDILKLIHFGQLHFSEKYLQEAEAKFSAIKVLHPHLHLNFFGKLQTNKIARILQFFDTVESVSRPKEVDYIEREMNARDIKTKEFFVQLNIGNEPQKNGTKEEQLEELLNYCSLKKLKISGLMVIPPKSSEPHRYFEKARNLANYLGLIKCQMGFSEDYPIAIASGANQLRIARLFFNNK